ncbi:hypothetical protein HLH34_02510 [Gluconacetobacter azotocaptans]|uniref:Uncharacterized protein n=1 Tax=Gluconacetobacter azotocaptans TaxID=142834 RepID=A0A7W4JQ25_9PROT|nr:hypothetical protein [Gluconacetobacter azotocaptans]MBB2188837.1 hypothetical protein [Gluconacetobacter azotocaptans]
MSAALLVVFAFFLGTRANISGATRPQHGREVIPAGPGRLAGQTQRLKVRRVEAAVGCFLRAEDVVRVRVIARRPAARHATEGISRQVLLPDAFPCDVTPRLMRCLALLVAGLSAVVGSLLPDLATGEGVNGHRQT